MNISIMLSMLAAVAYNITGKHLKFQDLPAFQDLSIYIRICMMYKQNSIIKFSVSKALLSGFHNVSDTADV